MFSQLLQVSSSVIVVGDFNFDLLSTSCFQKRYAEILSDFCFVQQVNEPPHVTDQSATLVDHLLVTPNLLVLRSVQSLGLSDHHCQIMEVDTPAI